MILVYVDDIIVLRADDVHIDEVVTAFKTQYAMQDLGDLQHYLGIITIERSEGQIKLHQTAYANDVVARFNHLLSCTSGMTVAISTMEAEYMTAYAAIQEIVWIRGVMTELELNGFQLSKDASPTILNMDSKSAIHRTLLTTRGQSISESSIIGFVSKWKATSLD